METDYRINKIKSLSLAALLAPFIVMLITGVGMLTLGIVKPCKGLHDGGAYYNYSCGDVCCQQACSTQTNKCESFPSGMMYIIGSVMIVFGAIISLALFLYKKHLIKASSVAVRENQLSLTKE